MIPSLFLNLGQRNEGKKMNKLDSVKVATLNDLPAVSQLYETICQHQPLDQYGADWTWGEYPSTKGLKKMIEEDDVLIGYLRHKVVAGGVLTRGEEYPDVNWPTKVADEQVGVLHLFGVHPDVRRTGLSAEMLQAVLHHARRGGIKVLHLDVLADNIPSEKLYVKNGFKVVQALTIHYDDIGDQAAKVLECRLF